MKVKHLLLTSAAVATLFLTSTSVNASINSISTHATSTLNKGTTYKLHLKVPGRLTVKATADYTIKNSAGWKVSVYPGKNKDTKIYYMRSGNYTVTTTSNSKLQTSFTKLTSLRNELDSYPVMNRKEKPATEKIKLGQSVKGMLDMYRTYKNDTRHDYEITLNKPQKVSLDIDAMPIYQGHLSRLFATFNPTSALKYPVNTQEISGKKHRIFTWYLSAGTYKFDFANFRGLYKFKVTGEDTDKVPETSKITKINPTDKGLALDFTTAAHATKYGIYVNSDNTYGGKQSYPRYYTDGNETNYTIPTTDLINGETISLGIVGVNTDYNAYGAISEIKKYTYYRPLTTTDKIPNTPIINLSYYDDNGNDEPYVSVKWDENKAVDSYEVAYRVKGTSNWTTFITNQKKGDTFDKTNDFKKGVQFEVRVRALTSSLKSEWSDIKTVTITNNPA